MDLDPAGREYAHWPVTNPDAVALQVSFDEVTWYATTAETGGVYALVAGPAATSNPGGTIVLARGTNTATIRATAGNEIVMRPAGTITVA